MRHVNPCHDDQGRGCSLAPEPTLICLESARNSEQDSVPTLQNTSFSCSENDNKPVHLILWSLPSFFSEEPMNKWKSVHHCKNIQSTSCNLTCAVPKFVQVRARVKAVFGPFQSPWVESQSKEYHLDGECLSGYSLAVRTPNSVAVSYGAGPTAQHQAASGMTRDVTKHREQ